MASYAQLQGDVKAWLKRRDVDALIPSWVLQAETDINATLRARCMVVRGTQAIDANFITLPVTFAEFESVRFTCCGNLLSLEDHFSGPLAGGPTCQCASPATWAYRLVGGCIEWLPHPTIPNPPDPSWVPQTVDVAWYSKVTPLVNPQDTNPVLDQLYSVYLFNVVRYGAMYGLDDDRAQQMGTAFADVVTAANNWKTASDYSGAPLRAVVRSF